jgi:hypothetical protein
MYRTLDPDKIVLTLEQLEARISARFPKAGLARVAHELTDIARESKARAERLARPNWRLRLLVLAVLNTGVVVAAWVASLLLRNDSSSSDIYGQLQGIDAFFNITLLAGAAILFLVTMEARLKRKAAVEDLHVLRSIVHVIDMHQLTKDPSPLMAGAPETEQSPKRTLTPFELTRYLDYCSEMLSLTAKVAAIYAQSTTDTQVIEAANDLERLTASLSQKIWQKITIVERLSPAVLPQSGVPLT